MRERERECVCEFWSVTELDCYLFEYVVATSCSPVVPVVAT